MQELIEQLKHLVYGVWLPRWIAVLIAWMVCLVGWPFALKYPDQFESQAKVYVDTQSLLSPLLCGLTIQTNPAQQVQLIVKTLFTRPNLEKIARLSDLDVKTQSDQEFELVINQLRSGLKLGQAGRDNIYNISYSSSSANEAKNVVQATLTTLVEKHLGRQARRQRYRRGFPRSPDRGVRVAPTRSGQPTQGVQKSQLRADEHRRRFLCKN